MSLVLKTKTNSSWRLKEIEYEDIEYLRVWKNTHKLSFFYQNDISEEDQKKWYSKYSLDKFNVMFVVQEYVDTRWHNVGCMGYRLIHENSLHIIDVYNIMRGLQNFRENFSMGEAFNLMNAFIVQTYLLPVTCKVLKHNPARAWYEKNYFNCVTECDDYVVYNLQKNNIFDMSVVCEDNV